MEKNHAIKLFEHSEIPLVYFTNGRSPESINDGRNFAMRQEPPRACHLSMATEWSDDGGFLTNKKIRTQWVEEEQKWYFSIIDIIAILTDSPNPRKYWSVLKTRLKAEGSQLATNCSQLKLQSQSTLDTCA